ncbi:hypothetical protein F2Q69_00009559 [Brassica cretica]|uniref:Uncharacterized protein n=1 Tax=Brassica cretica TaxID=69181 RepID=A0A8S9PHG1_BRACR|nr:hypothetical protein F2Q69_00009559 [Brassica cretica]
MLTTSCKSSRNPLQQERGVLTVLPMTTRPVGPRLTALQRTDPNPSIMGTTCPIIRLLKGEVGGSNLTNNLIMGQVVPIMEGLGSVRCSAVSLGPTGRVVTLPLSTVFPSLFTEWIFPEYI